jgi:hypothetical protein
MLSARNVLAPTGRRSLLRSLVAGSAVAVSVVLPGAVAAADEPDGTTVVGRLVQAWPEVAAGSAEPGAVEGPISWVEPAAGDAVRVPTEDVEGIPSGATVEVTVDGHHAGEDDPLHEVLDTGVVTLPAAPVPTPTAGLTNQVTVALVTPDGVGRDAVTEQQLIDLVDGPVADFWSEETDGAIRLGVTTAHDWVTPDAGCSDPTAMWNEVAATVGFVPGPGKHLLLYVSSRRPAARTRSARSAPPPAAVGGCTSGTPVPRSSRTSSATTSVWGTPRDGSATRRWSPMPAGRSAIATTTTSWASPGPSSGR